LKVAIKQIDEIINGNDGFASKCLEAIESQKAVESEGQNAKGTGAEIEGGG